MDITTRVQNDILIVGLSGRLDTQTQEKVEQAIDAALATTSGNVVFNMAELEYMSSVGLLIVIRTAKLLRQNGFDLCLCCANGLIKEVLDISDIGGLVGVYDSEAAALESF